jgi:WD40 repeat protein
LACLLVTGGVGDPTEIWQIPTATARPITQLVDRRSSHKMAAFSPDGNRIISVADSWAAVWDAKTGAAIAYYGPDEENLVWAYFSSNSHTIVTLSKEGVARIWEVPASGTLDAFRVACQKLGSTSSLGIISAEYGLADLKPICSRGSEPLEFDPTHLASNQ